MKSVPMHSLISLKLKRRSGATLVEVLMALLVMAIGVTSVFTLFPLSILKAVKANQLTNAKLYEGTIRDTLLGTPQLWTGAPLWQESSAYYWPANAPHDPTIAPYPSRWATPPTSGNLLPDTNLLFRCQLNTSIMGPPSAPYYSGNKAPSFGDGLHWIPNDLDSGSNPNFGGYRNSWPSTLMNQPAANLPVAGYEGVLEWIPYRHSQFLANGTWSAYIVDPLGWHRHTGTPDQAQFGRILSGDTVNATMIMDRIHCQLSSAASDQVFRLQDAWSMTIETTPVTATLPVAGRIQVQFPDTMDVTGQTDRHRIVLLSTRSTRVITLPLSSGPTVTYPVVPGASAIEFNGVLPSGYVVDQARIEVQNPARYSWLMAIHADPRGRFEAQCAVVLNRSFEALDEQGYRAEFCQSEIDLNGDGDFADAGEDDFWANGRVDTNMAKVRWPYNPDVDSPRLREGGYIFDAAYGYWYQIQKIEPLDGDQTEQRVDASDTPNTSGAYVRSILRLSNAVEASTGAIGQAAPFSDYLANGTHDGRAVIIPGVIHTFPVTP